MLIMTAKIYLSFTRNLNLEGEGERCLLTDFFGVFFNSPGLKAADNHFNI